MTTVKIWNLDEPWNSHEIEDPNVPKRVQTMVAWAEGIPPEVARVTVYQEKGAEGVWYEVWIIVGQVTVGRANVKADGTLYNCYTTTSVNFTRASYKYWASKMRAEFKAARAR